MSLQGLRRRSLIQQEPFNKISFGTQILQGLGGLGGSTQQTIAPMPVGNPYLQAAGAITGLGTGSALQAAVAGYLNDLYPAAAINNGKQAKLHCTSYANATASGIDVNSAKTISYVAVDANGTLNQSVVQDVVFAGASGNVSLSATRSLMRYQSNGSGWEWQSTTAY